MTTSHQAELCLQRRAKKLPEHLRDYVVGSVLNTVADIPIPNTYKQAKASKYWPEWKAAMEDELASLRAHGTWQLVARTTAKKQAVITNRWVFVVKRDAQGRIQRFKARLVIHGFKQKYGVDYVE
ncbi:polyprotein, partial [Phytophthora megakarya]